MATTNRGGMATAVNFLDGAAGLPNTPPPMSSNTYILLTHLYQFFGALLGCDAMDFPAYMGVADMYEVHKFMFLNTTQNDYFIRQVGAAALNLGVTEADAMAVGGILDSVFNRRCTPDLTMSDGVPMFLVGTNPSLCHAESCEVLDEMSCPMDMDDMTMTPTMTPNMAPSTSMPTMMPAIGDSVAAATVIWTTSMVAATAAFVVVLSMV